MMLQAVSSPGIVVMAPQVLASMASMAPAHAPFPLASTASPLAATSCPLVAAPGTQAASDRASPGALRTVSKIASDWDSDDDQ
jgi:hypothetical protein